MNHRAPARCTRPPARCAMLSRSCTMCLASCHGERARALYALRTPVAGGSRPGAVFKTAEHGVLEVRVRGPLRGQSSTLLRGSRAARRARRTAEHEILEVRVQESPESRDHSAARLQHSSLPLTLEWLYTEVVLAEEVLHDTGCSVGCVPKEVM